MSKQLELFNKAKVEWEEAVNGSTARDYSFDTLSGESVDLLYYPKAPNDQYFARSSHETEFSRVFLQAQHSSKFLGFSSPQQGHRLL